MAGLIKHWVKSQTVVPRALHADLISALGDDLDLDTRLGAIPVGPNTMGCGAGLAWSSRVVVVLVWGMQRVDEAAVFTCVIG